MSLRNSLKNYLAAVAVLIMLAGIRSNAGRNLSYWSRAALQGLTAWTLLFVLFSVAVRWWRPAHARWAVMAAVMVYLAVGAGTLQTAGTLYFLASAIAMGLWVREWLSPISAMSSGLAESLFTGLGCFLALFGALMYFPVNGRWVYLVLLSTPLVSAVKYGLWKRHEKSIVHTWRETRIELEQLGYAEWCLFLGTVGFIGSYAFFPSVEFDDQVAHLSLWTQLSRNHFVHFDPRTFIGAVQPFAGDLIHGVISTVVGQDVRAALDLVEVVLLGHFMWILMDRMGATVRARFSALGLFMTTPIIACLLTGLETDLFLAMVTTGGCCLAMESSGSLDWPQVISVWMTASILAAVKFPALALSFSLAVLLAWSVHKKKISLSMAWTTKTVMAVFVLSLVGLFVAIHAYGLSYLTTGNPVFPFFNAFFKSSLYPPINFVDLRWQTGANLRSLWEFFFKTSRHYESRDFVAGFQYLFLFPLGAVVVAFSGKKARESLLLMVPIALYGAAMFKSLQYWRYFFAVLPLAAVLMAGLFGSAGSSKDRWMAFIFLVFGGINLFFLPGVLFIGDQNPLKCLVPRVRTGMVDEIAPEQHLNAMVDPYSAVFYLPQRPYGSTYPGTSVYSNWYNPQVSGRISGWKNPQDVADLMRDEKIGYVYWNLGEPFDPQSPFQSNLDGFLIQHAVPEFQAGGMLAYRLGDPGKFQEALKVDRFGDLSGFYVNGRPVKSPDGALSVDQSNFVTRAFSVGAAHRFRYSASLVGPPRGATFMAQINWDKGLYYRQVKVGPTPTEFVESGLVPTGARLGILYVVARGMDPVTVRGVKLEVQ
jgi:hypothetical protein